MAIQCTNCGQISQNDNVQFCSRCGTLFSPAPSAAGTSFVGTQVPGQNSYPPAMRQPSRPAIREQIAQQPPARPTRSNMQNTNTRWGNQAEHAVHNKPFPEDSGIDPDSNAPTLTWPNPSGTYPNSVTRENLSTEPTPQGFSQPDLALPYPFAPQRKTQGPPSGEQAQFRQGQPTIAYQQSSQTQMKPLSYPPIAPEQQAWSIQSAPVQPNPVGPIYQPVEHVAGQQPPRTLRSFSQPGIPAGHEWKHTPDFPVVTTAEQSQASAAPQKKNRKLLVFVLFLVFLLIAGGIGAWIVLFQPFAVPDITQPQQHFQNPSLGVSLQYPSGWTTQMDAKTGAVHFYDSTHTDQANIVAANANGTNAGQYLQKEAAQLGITALKTRSPASFAGTTWQQAQGTLLQNGANYTETLFVTLHNQRFYTFMQIAPQSTYNDEDRLIFSSMRSTFQFVG